MIPSETRSAARKPATDSPAMAPAPRSGRAPSAAAGRSRRAAAATTAPRAMAAP